MGACLEGVSSLNNTVVPATPRKGFKVCVCGSSGGIGQPLSLLMSLDPRVWELSVYDLTISMVPAEGIGADLGHIERKCRVTAYSLETTQKAVDYLGECFKDCVLVLIPAGVPSKGRTQSELLKINANIAKSIVEACAKHCPQAIIGLIVNPMNSIVPAMARLYEKNKLDPMKICGITTLDVVRANKFVHEETGTPIEKVNIPVVGGFSASMPCAAVPLFSQDPNASKMSPERQEAVNQRLRDAGNTVTQAKKNKGTATLSMAYAGARFGQSVLAGLSGIKSEEYVLVKTSPPVCEDLEYFATRVTFGPKGVEKVHQLGNTTPTEQARLKEVSQQLREEVKAGIEYAEESDLCAASALPGIRPPTH